MTTETRVTFNLWAVLAFLFLAGVVSIGFLYAEGKETKVQLQEVAQRAKVLEMQYEHIIKGLDKLTTVVEKVADKVELHTREAKSNAVVKKWNDIE